MYLFQTYFALTTPVYVALLKTSGIGKKMSMQTCDRLGFGKGVLLGNLSSTQYARLNQIVNQNILVENEYRAYVQKRVKRLRSMSCYRGFRHYEGLPCRGQRTHTNARTLKGRRRTTSRKRAQRD